MIEILVDDYCLIHGIGEDDVGSPKKIVTIEKKNI